MAIAIVEELWTRIRSAIDDKIIAAQDAVDRAATSATNAKTSETAAAQSASEAEAALSTKADLIHTHTVAQVNGLQSALDGKASLVGGLIPTSQLPAVALTKPQVVSGRAGMLALTAQEGDVAVITAGADKGTYMLGPGASTNFASWVALATPTDAVTSVNGQTGVVNLSASNVGAAPSSHTHTSGQVSDATFNPTAYTIIKRDASGRAQVAAPYSAGDIATKGYVDQEVGKKAAGVSVKEHGAVGNGTTNDTAAIKAAVAALGAGGTLIIPEGRYLVTETITVSQDEARIVGSGTLAAGTSQMTVVALSGANIDATINVDGCNLAGTGVSVTGPGTVVRESYIRNILATSLFSTGISVVNGGRGATIAGNTIRNISSAGDNTVMGDASGASRGIYAYSDVPATEPLRIYDNLIDGVTGEEGDGIQIINYDGVDNNLFLKAAAKVARNTVRNCSRRGIKIQASDVLVSGNEIFWDKPTAPTNPSYAINVINSDDVHVEGNRITKWFDQNGIQVSGPSARLSKGIRITDNDVTLPEGVNLCIYVNYLEQPTIERNTTRGGSGVIVSRSNDAVVSGNTSMGGAASTYAVWAYSNSNNTAILSNVNLNKGRTTPFRNQSVSGTTLYNW
ncbi:hypothetical protein PETEYPAB_28 [Corynebacterium phage PeteyPab]|uniref:Uncharacterized protein n=1 Tax=Corynebacterium phage PeteyPab TaxID=2483663 RepID=A0A3G3M9W3_9CAUD|nr:hypothetical protein PETEYPAB_28 [Corynebacterium phage PeteyPab]